MCKLPTKRDHNPPRKCINLASAATSEGRGWHAATGKVSELAPNLTNASTLAEPQPARSSKFSSLFLLKSQKCVRHCHPHRCLCRSKRSEGGASERALDLLRKTPTMECTWHATNLDQKRLSSVQTTSWSRHGPPRPAEGTPHASELLTKTASSTCSGRVSRHCVWQGDLAASENGLNLSSPPFVGAQNSMQGSVDWK